MNTGIIALILGVLLSVSELLAAFPTIKSNSIFQLIQNLIKSLSGKSTEVK